MAALWLIVRILLWVLAVLLGLVVLALFVPITAELRADETGFAAWLRVLFVRIKLYPRPEKRGKAPARKAQAKKRENAPARTEGAACPGGRARPRPERAAGGPRKRAARARGACPEGGPGSRPRP